MKKNHPAEPASTEPRSSAGLPVLTVDLARAARRADDLPTGWTDDDIDRAVLRYRRFLALVAEAPTVPAAPTREIDFVWHLHMLSPRAYVNDCVRLLGDVLDHDGGFGKTPAEEPALIACYRRTADRYEARFGEPYADRDASATSCWHDCQSRCWHACKSVAAAAA